MYIEFIIAYIGLAITILLLIANLILLLKRTSSNASVQSRITAANIAPKEAGAIVFCKSCAAQFDASQHYCPKCGTPRL